MVTRGGGKGELDEGGQKLQNSRYREVRFKMINREVRFKMINN